MSIDVFEKPSVTVDAVVISWDWRILLVRRKNNPYKGFWALPGGFVNEGEEPKDAVLRELQEETNLTNATVQKIVGVYGGQGRDSRGWIISIGYRILPHPGHMSQIVAQDDAVEVDWFLLDDLPILAFDHNSIVIDALN